MKRNWDGISQSFFSDSGFLGSLLPRLYVCSFTFYSVLSFLIFSCSFFFVRVHFNHFPSFTSTATFFERSFVDFVQTKIYVCRERAKMEIYLTYLSAFLRIFLFMCLVVWDLFNARTLLHAMISWPFRENVRVFLHFFHLLCYTVLLLASNLFHLVLFFIIK